MKKSLFESLQAQADEDVKLPDQLEELMKRDLLQATYVQKWVRLWSEQKNLVEQLKVEKNRLYGEKFKHYRFDDNVAWTNDKQIDSQVCKDPEYINLCRTINEQTYYLNFLAQTLENIKSMGFIIKEYLDYRKMLKN